MPETVISQDIKALIQTLGPSRCAIVIQNNFNTQPDSLWNIFKNLPEPRWKSLKNVLLQELVKRIPYSNHRALFAGISERTMRAWERDLEAEKNSAAPIGTTIKQIEAVSENLR